MGAGGWAGLGSAGGAHPPLRDFWWIRRSVQRVCVASCWETKLGATPTFAVRLENPADNLVRAPTDKAYEASQRYKEGKFILEKAMTGALALPQRAHHTRR